MLFAKFDKLCWKYLTVSINFTSFLINAKFILDGLQTFGCKPFNNKKKSNLSRLCAKAGIV